jgi:DNA-binding cell septation regulator SpoVG
MEVSIKWFNDNFNLILATAAGKDPFLEIKGCRIVDGRNGPFVSYPSRKQENGTYWNHVYASEAFNNVVLSKAQESQPKAPARRQAAPAGGGGGGADDEIPFTRAGAGLAG